MKKILIILAFSFILASCTSVTDKIKVPKMERKTCDGSNKTVADVLCKKN
jgi:starvation-inducible outer membrane lipoprotein